VPLPRSTLVFAAVSCVPFGLAIRDTVAGTYAGVTHGVVDRSSDVDPDEDEAEVEDVREAERAYLAHVLERNRRYAAEQRASEATEQRRAMHDLVGRAVASPGRLFGNLALGLPARSIAGASASLAGFRSKYAIDITLVDDGGRLHMIYIRPMHRDRREACDELGRQLELAWGSGDGDVDVKTWRDAPSGRRAVFDLRNGCELRYDQERD
jgi:hypothetical protein